MPPKSTGPPPRGQLVFVGGPSLKGHPGSIRSTLLQRAHRERRAKLRQDAADRTNRLDSLLQQRMTSWCTCPPLVQGREGEFSALVLRDGPRHRAIRPRRDHLQTAEIQPQRCSVCGGLLPSAPAIRGDFPGDQSVEFFGAGSYDPALPLDSESSALRVHELLHHANTRIWPYFRPLGYTANCYRSWVFPYDEKVKLYAILWSTSYHRDTLRATYDASSQQFDSKEQLQLKALALRSLRAAVANVTQSTAPDGIVMCILFLAVNDLHRTGISRDPSPFSPSFTSLHYLDFYGSRDYHPLHWNVVCKIVENYGGIETLRIFALAWLLCISDLMNAVHLLRKPIFPLLGAEGKRLASHLHPPLLLFRSHSHHFSRSTAGSSFLDLLFLIPPVKREIVTAFVNLGEYSSVLQHYSREPYGPVVLDLLGDSRNLTHHHLLSLPDENDHVMQILEYDDHPLEQIEMSRDIYLTCRLSAILYAVHVTFPIPRSAFLRETILAQLCPRVTRLLDQNVSSRLLLWCVVIATIALGEKAGQLTPYVNWLCHELRVDTFEELLGLLRSFAWVDAAAQGRCEEIWAKSFRS
ncbi:hypothetical protein BBP40_010860 [Aspergillus hancockii]|nr:hypothetical protein BBP40_010860 [Aspergillus hancockii]